MIKKALYITALLLANIILLGHPSVPHHHHGNGMVGVCFCQCHHDTQTTGHEENAFPEECSIDTVYAPAENSLLTPCRVQIKCDGGQGLFTPGLNALYTQDYIDSSLFHFRYKPYEKVFHTQFTSQSLGLRAPPVC